MFRLVIPELLLEEVIEHARLELPNECCGLLAGVIEGDTGRVTTRFTIGNDAASPTAFRTEVRSLFAAYRAMRADGTDVLAVYHSHPTSAPTPSRRDVAENTYGPNVAWVIVGLAGEEPDVRAWWLTGDGFRAAEWCVG